ncbi:hypothetical protein DVH24_036051 [Malus domestica]|uniref:HAT C-terminal dimerisation domain-containing protein n=1 Tax=Malus domestica TaxID=3750 RepID=A0A498JTZ3_MALDO|nr:hypothetical protein DVH24_036051 [Malus domestica]
MGNPLRSSRVSSQKQNREGVVGIQSRQYRATAESSPKCGGGLGRDDFRNQYQSLLIGKINFQLLLSLLRPKNNNIHVYINYIALVLPIATASMERAISAMNIVKSPLRNRMRDQWLSNSMVVYIESNVFSSVDMKL